jgi:hypothetical protein
MQLDKLQIAQPQPASMLLQAMGMKDRQRRTDIAADRNAIAREGQLLNREQFEFNKMRSNLEYGKQYIPTMGKQDYRKYIDWMKKIGAGDIANMLPTPSEVENMDENQYGQFKQSLILGVDGLRDMTVEQFKAGQKEAQAQRDQQRAIELEKVKQGRAAKTAMEKFIKDNPDASAQDLIDFQQRLKGKGIRILPDGTVEIGGPQDLGIATKNKLQKEVVDLSGQLQQVTNLENNELTDVLTLQGKIYQKGLRLADFLKVDIGEENKEYLGKARVFIENIEKVFNAYRKEITGAQAAMKEIEMLRTSVLNKKLTPTEFKHSLKSYKEAILRGLRLKRMLLAQGVSGKDLPQKLDEIYVSGRDVPDSEMDRRGDELLSEGLSETETVQKLREEGYDL